jgi:cbb3-type cytochrome oxidase cytochrome c subunit
MHNDPSIAAVGEHRTFTWYEKFLLTPSPTIPASFLTN